MGEDSDPETGSDAVDDPADGESEPSGGRARDDRRSDDSDSPAGDADDRTDSAEATDGDDSDEDETVAQVDLDADSDADTGSANGTDDDTTSESADSGPVAESDAASNGDVTDDSDDADGTTAVVDPVTADDASRDNAENSPPEDATTDTADSDTAIDDGLDPVADAVPDAGGPDKSPLDRADEGPVGPPRSPDPAPAPNAVEGPDADADPESDPHSAATSADAAATEDVYGPVPAEAESEPPDADAAADAHAHATETESSDIAPIHDDPGDHSGFDEDAGGIVGEGPAEDEEMPLAAHIEEMMRRLGIVFLIGGVVLIAAFPAADRTINFLWNTHIPGASAPTSPRRPRLYGPLELILTELKVAGLAGFVAGLPALVYQSYRFMRPGLYPKERRYYLASVPTSLVLALVGVAFAHFIVLPAVFAYFTSYTANADIVVAFGLRETFNLILLLMGYMALVFQIPLFMMLGVMMGLVTRQWMTDKRLLFWGGFLGVSFLISPDPTGMTPIIVAATMITLFEGTLLLIKWTGTGKEGLVG